MWPGMVGFCPWELHHNPKEGRDRWVSIREVKGGPTEIIDTTSQRLSRGRPTNRSSPPNTTIPMPRLPSHPPTWASYGSRTMGLLSPTYTLRQAATCFLQEATWLQGVRGPGRLLSQRAPGWGSGGSALLLSRGLQRRIRRQAGRLCVFTNWRWWKNMQREFRCQMPLLEVHLKCLGIDQPHCRHPWGSFPAEAAWIYQRERSQGIPPSAATAPNLYTWATVLTTLSLNFLIPKIEIISFICNKKILKIDLMGLFFSEVRFGKLILLKSFKIISNISVWNDSQGTSLVVQWLRICLPIQGM